MIRILHTSDWHIGRVFYDRSLIEDQEHVLGQIIDLAGQEKPDAVVIAGDIYDRAIPPPEGIKLLDWALSELVLTAKVPVFLISGNHDSAGRLGFGSRLLSGHHLRIVSSLKQMLEPMVLEDSHGKVELFGIPYSDPSEVRVESQDPQIQGHQESLDWCVAQVLARRKHPAILSAHAYVVGGEGTDSERPLSIGGKPYVKAESFEPFVYTALGHLHGRQSFGSNVHYSGSLLPYHFSERDTPKSVNLVELDKDRVAAFERIPLSPRRKLVLISGTADEVLAQAKAQPNAHDYVLVRREYDRPRPDLMQQLRQFYPNIVNLETLARQSDRPTDGSALRETVRKGTDIYELFSGFYQKMALDPLSELQARRLAEQLKEEQ